MLKSKTKQKHKYVNSMYLSRKKSLRPVSKYHENKADLNLITTVIERT